MVGETGSDLSARKLVGLLAEPDRLRVVAALVLGADSLTMIAAQSDLTVRQVSDALDRLRSAGLVDAVGPDQFLLLEAAFKRAARQEVTPPPDSAFPDQPANVRSVLDRVLRDGRLIELPARWGQKKVVLDWVAQRFEPGTHYTERQVNASLAEIHDDTASLRRYLVDAGMMDRANGEYWRSGGTVRDVAGDGRRAS